MSDAALASSLKTACVIEDHADVRDLIEQSIYEAMLAHEQGLVQDSNILAAVNVDPDAEQEDLAPSTASPIAGQAVEPPPTPANPESLSPALQYAENIARLLVDIAAPDYVKTANTTVREYLAAQIIASSSTPHPVSTMPEQGLDLQRS